MMELPEPTLPHEGLDGKENRGQKGRRGGNSKISLFKAHW